MAEIQKPVMALLAESGIAHLITGPVTEDYIAVCRARGTLARDPDNVEALRTINAMREAYRTEKPLLEGNQVCGSLLNMLREC